jgi:thiosulfate/3-mercaptopyruvate sulfurtransferase
MSASLIAAAELRRRLGSRELVLLHGTVELPPPRFDGDHIVASGRAGWLAGHVPTARHADLVATLSDAAAATTFHHLSADATADAFAALGVGDDSDVVLYDRGDGLWAARLWWLLRWIGKPAAILDGGLQAWIAAGGEVVRGEEPPSQRAVLTARPRSDVWIEREQVEAISRGQADGRLICALSRAAFAGTVPTRYARRGHIPGSVVLTAREFVASDGGFVPLEVARALAEATLPNRAEAIALYCGGGVSATLAAFALERLGYARLSVYDGSLEEWSANPALALTQNI